MDFKVGDYALVRTPLFGMFIIKVKSAIQDFSGWWGIRGNAINSKHAYRNDSATVYYSDDKDFKILRKVQPK